MHVLVRSTENFGIAMTATGVLAVMCAVLPAELQSPPAGFADLELSVDTTSLPITPPLGALVQQFVANQVTDCSLICPFIVQLASQPVIEFALIPVTFVQQLQSGEPLLQAIALTDATVSGAANTALTGIITNDLNAALPRAQHSLEVAVLGLVRTATTAITRPVDLPGAIASARTDLFGALQQTPGPTPPAVHTAFEAATVRAIEVASALVFQAPERLLLGVTQAADVLFTTVGATGNVGTALAAVGASVTTTVGESVALIRHALNEPIPITPAAMTTVRTTVSAVQSQGHASTSGAQQPPVSSASDGTAHRASQAAAAPSVKRAPKPRATTSAENSSSAEVARPRRPARSLVTRIRDNVRSVSPSAQAAPGMGKKWEARPRAAAASSTRTAMAAVGSRPSPRPSGASGNQ